MSLRPDWGLALEAVPADELDSAVEALADRIAGVPLNQLAMQKMMINQAYDNMGLQGTQVLATLFDGITRSLPGGGAGSRILPSATDSMPRFSTAIPDARFQTEAGRSPRPTPLLDRKWM